HFDYSIQLEQALSEKNPEVLAEIDKINELADIHYIRQKKPLGLGHAILCAKKHVGCEPFAVLLGDDIIFSEKPAIRQCIEWHEKKNASVIAVEEVAREMVSQYGIVDADPVESGLFKINDLVEKPPADKAPSNLGIVGRYVLTPEVFQELEATKAGVGGEIQLTDALKGLNKRQKMYAWKFSGKRYDLGTKLDYLKANVEYALQRDDLKKEFGDYLKNLEL
ncbi:MAG TPA: UTP--glucose-1-phosphate uridylyltransferase, partial [Candidatus Altiarchaeales archaeon]|nr:UTP--glucose-1-phosphate uridylyltransferase [Candidatus Altiarchaeales archaeon]